MNGAESLVRSLHAAGVEVCFANPGTSEMQFVDALDRTRLLRCVLALFEGGATGMADGYARMAGKPAVTLLHLGPGLSNASANIHNAKRARSPMVNLVGEHASWHIAFDPPLAADIAGLAAPVSDWVRTTSSPATIAADGVAAVAAARSWPGRIATLIAPGDHGWDEGGVLADPVAPEGPRPLDDAAVAEAARLLDGAEPALLYVGGAVIEDPEALALAHAIAARAGADLLCPTSFRRVERGGGRAGIERLPYAVDLALPRLAHLRRAVLVEAKAPVAFFGYPGRPSEFLPAGCATHTLAGIDQDGRAALTALADLMGVRPAAPGPAPSAPPRPQAGRITPETLAAAIGSVPVEGAIYVDEGITAGRGIYPALAGAPAHTWLPISGGAIGIGVPLATGAAIAAPDRPVIALQADGSAMYTLQALWTQAREGLNVKTVIFANRSYAILKQELARTGANPGPSALALLDLDRPELDFVSLARGMGVDGVRVDCPRALADRLEDALAEPGPFLIEAML